MLFLDNEFNIDIHSLIPSAEQGVKHQSHFVQHSNLFLIVIIVITVYIYGHNYVRSGVNFVELALSLPP